MKTRRQKLRKTGFLIAEDPDPFSTGLSSRCRYGADSVDRISELPDSVLGHILSFLPTKKAVVTRILSKRWNLVWMTVGNLDFRYPGPCDCNEYDFVDFVNYVLLLRKPASYLNGLSITLETESVPIVQACIDSWICAAFARNVHDLFVSAKNFNLTIQTQRIMFGCETLRSIELNCNFYLSFETTFSLPRLESLKLSSITVKSKEDFCKVLGACPVLKYLFMDFYMDFYMGNVNEPVFKCSISSSSLRHLELYVRNKCPIRRGDICLIYLTAPSLEYIKLEDHVCVITVKQPLNSLVEANIHLASLEVLSRIRRGASLETPIRNQSYIYVVEAFQAFKCAEALTLSAQVIRVLSCVRDKMITKFERLTRLEVTTDRNHWSAVQDLIKLSDSLEVVTIKKDRDTCENYLDNSSWEPPDLVPGCLSTSLRTVSIDVCDGHHSELEMVHYILKHGRFLQVMKICLDESSSDLTKKLEMVKKISKFSKTSPVCQVKFC